MLSIKNLYKSYQDAEETRLILQDLSIEVAQGASISIQGESGSGKSTLLHLLATLDKPDSGELIVQSGEQRFNLLNLSESQADEYRKRQLGIIFQKYNLIDCISVYENVLLPAHLSQKLDPSYLQGLLSTLGIAVYKHKLPEQLSGGEQQRVAIARALAHQPQLVLADEPTGNLDHKNAAIVSRLLVDTCKQLNTTLVLVTHSEKVANLTDYQYRLVNGALQLSSSK
ncbi:MAG: ABC transporter ATP-binding protein [Paraglaciecola sp.]|uniref:ABC transporter ATP-binding protein n=1 Tax=Paraglaciecola sp. TaxID=1920173 RepID=UPI00273DB7D2|nr:ABC transporter ATP-binding protein [Paraglaciecola sp.]MDP5031186.1 ABC transporter ATP-binding protein [Paraglaciecola sp.]MDP5133415.1 ABC transporter ATP-binding protein [Paraglaciecola sp.]